MRREVIDPAGFDGDAVTHLDTVFAIADRHGVGVDVHLHDRGSLGRHELDLAGREVRVLVAVGALGDLAGHLQHELGAQRVGDGLVTDDHLGHAARITQIDEGDASVVTTTVDPPGEGDGLADVLGPQRSGSVSA